MQISQAWYYFAVFPFSAQAVQYNESYFYRLLCFADEVTIRKLIEEKLKGSLKHYPIPHGKIVLGTYVNLLAKLLAICKKGPYLLFINKK